MSCDIYNDLLSEYALGTLPEDKQAELRAHLSSGCPSCQRQLAELQATLALLPLELPAMSPSPMLRERLIRKVKSSKADAAASQRSGWRIGPLIGGAIAAAAVIAIGGAWLSEQRSIVDLQQQVAVREGQIADLRNTLASEQETLGAIRSPGAQMISMESAATPDAQGRIFMDPVLGRWWFSARGLKPLASGKTYEFWLIPHGQKPIAAGTFDVNTAGVGYLTGKVPANVGGSALAAVTDEPAGGLPQPTGSIQIKGSIGH